MLHLENFQKALSQFKSVYSMIRNDETMMQFDPDVRIAMKQAMVQNFEICYELSWKLIRRYLKQSFASDEIDALSRKDLFRLAGKNGIIERVEQWFIYHHARNVVAHTYDEGHLESINTMMPEFYKDITALHIALQEKS